MSKVNIRILSAAREDIGEIYYYIAVDNRKQFVIYPKATST